MPITDWDWHALKAAVCDQAGVDAGRLPVFEADLPTEERAQHLAATEGREAFCLHWRRHNIKASSLVWQGADAQPAEADPADSQRRAVGARWPAVQRRAQAAGQLQRQARAHSAAAQA